MSSFSYRENRFFVESVPLDEIAGELGTPCFVYSKAELATAYQNYDIAFGNHDHLICYAVKANSNLAVLRLFAELGSGFDIVSAGELQRVLAAGGNPQKVVFSGVGKSVDEIRLALNADILCFNVESESELRRLSKTAVEQKKIARISFRVNPDIDAKTHPYIATGLKQNKFGVSYEQASPLYLQAQHLPNIEIIGVGCHIGSQITELAPFIAAFEKILVLVDKLAERGIQISHLDLGGGLGIRYCDETPPKPVEHVQALLKILGTRKHKLLLEPGRSLVGNAGVLLTTVEYAKKTGDKNFLIVDAAMNDLMRPALYEAYHDILPLKRDGTKTEIYDVVGPVCESGDFLGLKRSLSAAEGDVLAIMSAGAYGMSMSSNYNTRPRAAEVLVDNDKFHVVRERESIDQLITLEKLPPT